MPAKKHKKGKTSKKNQRKFVLTITAPQRVCIDDVVDDILSRLTGTDYTLKGEQFYKVDVTISDGKIPELADRLLANAFRKMKRTA